jgi:ABC-type lipoprotein release transport system permease subunit
MFVRHGLLLTSIGLVCGLAAAMGVTRLMSALLFQISPLDPITYLRVPVFLVAAALLASYLPTRRASVIDPIEALRVE